MVLRSASGTLLGGIGIEPHAPLPPFFTFCSNLASADLSPAYFLAISLCPGPTTFLSTASRAWHLSLLCCCWRFATSTAALVDTGKRDEKNHADTHTVD